MRRIMLLLLPVFLAAFVGCEMAPRKMKNKETRDTRKDSSLPQPNQWRTGYDSVSHNWFEIYIQPGKELIGYYERTRTFYILKRKDRKGNVVSDKIPIMVHYVYKPDLREPVGFFTDHGRAYRYVWNDRKKTIEPLAILNHNAAIKRLLGYPLDTPIELKSASSDDHYIWVGDKFEPK